MPPMSRALRRRRSSVAKRVAPERAEPAYLRDNVALTLAEQQARKR